MKFTCQAHKLQPLPSALLAGLLLLRVRAR